MGISFNAGKGVFVIIAMIINTNEPTNNRKSDICSGEYAVNATRIPGKAEAHKMIVIK